MTLCNPVAIPLDISIYTAFANCDRWAFGFVLPNRSHELNSYPAFNCMVGIVVQLIVVRVDIEEGTMH